MTGARQEVLSRIRHALGPPGPPPDPPGHRLWARTVPAEEVMSRFQDRMEDYGSVVVRCELGGVAQAMAGLVMRRNVTRMVLPYPAPESWTSGVRDGGGEIVLDGGTDGDGSPFPLTKEELASAHGVVTGCALAIAETGTIVLQGGGTQRRRSLTLLPDYHLCLVSRSQIVGTVPEAVVFMAEIVRDTGSPLTLISGPSATSDIELIRVQGVHGPRTLDVILVEDG